MPDSFILKIVYVRCSVQIRSGDIYIVASSAVGLTVCSEDVGGRVKLNLFLDIIIEEHRSRTCF